MALPIVEHYIQLRDETVALYHSHKLLTLSVAALSIVLILFGMWAMRVRGTILANMNAPHKDASHEAYVAAIPSPVSSPSAYTDVLGTTDNSLPVYTEDVSFPTPTPYPTFAIPTFTPITATNTTTAVHTCAGTPTEDNSQVYVSPTTTTIGSSASIEVDLQDCNNAIAPVNDTLTITQVSGDAVVKINGSSAPVTLQANNGKVTLSVTSSNTTTATFLITNTTRSFPVTTPGYHNPSVTFTNSGSGSTGNANCTTSAGAPNTWYSDVYPNPPITTSNGSVTLQVVIRDCFKNTTTVNDSLTISLSSGDSGTKINGSNLPYTLSAQNGQASFTVTSQVNGTVTLVVTDTTSGFAITDPNNHNPSITFSGSTSSSPTDTPTPTQAVTDTPTPTPTGTTTSPTPTVTSTITPSPSP